MGNCLASWFSCFHSSNITPTTAAQPTGDGIGAGNGPLCPPVAGGRILESPSLKVFTFSDIKSATGNFGPGVLLGGGGSGEIYRGWVDETTLAPCTPGTGVAVAIKKLINKKSMQGVKEWQSKLNFLGRLSHPNLVKLLGYCWEDKQLYLVYEFVQKGSLKNHLFRKNATDKPLPWDLRLKVATGAARALAFLHTSDEQVIFHDFKTSGILLDDNYNSKIYDIEMVKLHPADGEPRGTGDVMGTCGYVAPEYAATGYLYAKSDVYSFGVILLELMTGLGAVDSKRPDGQHNLVDWLRPTLSRTRPTLLRKRRLKNIMDARMEGQYSSKAMLHAARVALKCLEPDRKARPSMKEVVEDLVKIQAIKDKPMLPRRGSGSGPNPKRVVT
ncbi:unnamed protein product [Linum trigynum]|uniref:non-specific serine/threonine protein kinase n=1 Tax=Linum trigynum TaxID=586398 RepID=A0AAV2F1I4_9ROSI